MVHFVGAGPGAPDLLTLRGAELLKRADVVIYAGSLVNPALLRLCRPDCRVHNSAEMTLEQVLAVMIAAEERGAETVRLMTGDGSLYGAIREQMDALAGRGIPFDVTPGVSSFCGAAAALPAEYTLPGVSQTVIITRLAGRTPVPDRESLAALASHGSSMAIFLSAGMLEQVQQELLQGGAYSPDTPAALVYKATWPEEQVCRCTVGTLARTGAEHGISKTTLILVGDFLEGPYGRSLLYDPAFTTGFRQGRDMRKGE
jgi:precorrin-4/cobalt-precorrin-4 C11-methyltransferase